MAGFYLDTSALVKRYHAERGSGVLDMLFRRGPDELVTSYWSFLELIVAFSFKRRRGELSSEAAEVVVSSFLRDGIDLLTVTGVTDELVAAATSLAVKHPLPSSDCLQLANVLEIGSALEAAGGGLVLVSSDRDLCNAARSEGIDVLNPEDDDALGRLTQILSRRASG